MEGDRRSRILGGMSADARNVTIALVSTVVFFTVLVLVITNSPGWPEVKTAFFNPTVFREAFPEVLRAFWLNIKIFCVAEVFILAFALVIAVLRSLPGPVFFPIRALAIVYTDFFRGNPDDPPDLHPRLRRAGARALWRPHLGARLGDGGADHHLLRLRRRGVSRRDRVCAPEPGRRGPLARAHAGRSRFATSSSRRPCAASSRRS